MERVGRGGGGKTSLMPKSSRLIRILRTHRNVLTSIDTLIDFNNSHFNRQLKKRKNNPENTLAPGEGEQLYVVYNARLLVYISGLYILHPPPCPLYVNIRASPQPQEGRRKNPISKKFFRSVLHPPCPLCQVLFHNMKRLTSQNSPPA